MEWFVFPAFTIGGIALGLVVHTIRHIKKLEKRIEELESKSK